MTTSRSKRVISLYIPAKFADTNLFDKLSAIAEKEDRSLNAIIVRILAEYVGKQSAPKEPKKARAKKPKTPKITETPETPSPGGKA